MVRHYDKLGRLTDVKLHTGTYGSGTLYATMSYTHRYDDQILTKTDFGNDTYTYTYDFLGRHTQILYPDSSTVSYSYDDTNNKITFTNGRGYEKIYSYDWLFRVTKVEEEYATDSFAVTTYQYDEIGHLTSFIDAENHTTSYAYASSFGLTKITYPNSTYEEYEYDNVGNITSFTDANANEIACTYDDVYRLTQIQYEDQSTVSFTYDLNSSRIRMEDDSPSAGDYVDYTYDYWNRITTETRHISTSSYTISYQYDVANRLTALTYPDNMQILYSYDDLNRMTEIKRYIDGANDEILLDNVQYNTESLPTQFDYGNDLEATFSYDSRDRLSTFDVKSGETSFLDLDYTHDNNSNITQLANGWRDTSSTWHSETESYSYDGLDRLTSASCTSWSHTYSYDEVGNRTSKDSVTYTINTVNEITALSDGTSFTYDNNGSRTQKTKDSDTWVYTYDYANRLTKVEKNSAILGEYVYDGDGRRIRVTENSTATTYVYSGLNILYEENSTGAATHIYGPTGRLAKRTTINQETNTFYYHTDHLGSTRLVTDEAKNIVTAVTYHPFGESDVEEGSEDYLFTGKEKDATGLYYYGSRYYDPEIGRFISRDPLVGSFAHPQTLNRYTYCVNNPLKYTDPWGQKVRDHAGVSPGSTGDDEEDDEGDGGEGDGGGEDDEGDGGEGDSNNNPPVYETEDGKIVTLDVYYQSGNVIVGYGYVTNTTGDGGQRLTIVFVVIVVDDEGALEECQYWDVDTLDDMNEVEIKDFTEKLKEKVGPENIGNLVNALKGLWDIVCVKADGDIKKSAAQGAIVGGAGGYICGPLVGGGAALAGALIGAIGGLSEKYKWQDRQTFIGNLLIKGCGVAV